MKKPNKVYILGTSGSGKSFLGRMLSKQLGITHYDKDDIYFLRKFDKKRSKAGMIKKVKELVKKRKWIFDGNGGISNKDLMKDADLVIWLQTSFRVRSYRILKRYLTRTGEHKEETLKYCLKLIKDSGRYKYGKGPHHYKGHEAFLKDNKIEYVVVRDEEELREVIEGL